MSALGAGGMGEVFLAHDTRLNRRVALKLLRAAASLDSDHLGRFVQEARAASALTHPHVAVVYDSASATVTTSSRLNGAQRGADGGDFGRCHELAREARDTALRSTSPLAWQPFSLATRLIGYDALQAGRLGRSESVLRRGDRPPAEAWG